jgi:hypothetical protein
MLRCLRNELGAFEALKVIALHTIKLQCLLCFLFCFIPHQNTGKVRDSDWKGRLSGNSLLGYYRPRRSRSQAAPPKPLFILGLLRSILTLPDTASSKETLELPFLEIIPQNSCLD